MRNLIILAMFILWATYLLYNWTRFRIKQKKVLSYGFAFCSYVDQIHSAIGGYYKIDRDDINSFKDYFRTMDFMVAVAEDAYSVISDKEMYFRGLDWEDVKNHRNELTILSNEINWKRKCVGLA